MAPKFGGKYDTKMQDGGKREGTHSWEGQTYPRKNFVPLIYLGGGPEWVCGVDGIWGHCKWRASMFCITPS